MALELIREEARKRASLKSAKDLAEATGYSAAYCWKMLSRFRREEAERLSKSTT